MPSVSAASLVKVTRLTSVPLIGSTAAASSPPSSSAGVSHADSDKPAVISDEADRGQTEQSPDLPVDIHLTTLLLLFECPNLRRCESGCPVGLRPLAWLLHLLRLGLRTATVVPRRCSLWATPAHRCISSSSAVMAGRGPPPKRR